VVIGTPMTSVNRNMRRKEGRSPLAARFAQEIDNSVLGNARDGIRFHDGRALFTSVMHC
jgi:hypothetical protein